MTSYNPSIPSQPSFSPGFSYPPPNFSHYPASYSPPRLPSSFTPLPSSYSASLGGRITSVPTTASGQPLLFQPTLPYTPPPLSFSVPSSVHPGSLPPSLPSPPSFSHSNPLQGRVEHYTPPSLPPGLPAAWANPPSLPMNFSPSYPHISNHSALSPASFQPLDPSSLRYAGSLPLSLPPSSLSGTSIHQQPPSLSGRAYYVSSFTLSPQGVLPSRSPGEASWTPLSPSSGRLPFSADTPGREMRVSSFPQHPRTSFPSFEGQLQIQQSLRREFEQTMKMIYQMDAPPERPFSMWGTMGVTQLAFQLNPQTTVFIDPLAVTEFFQRASSAQRWAFQAQLTQFMKGRDLVGSQFNGAATSNMNRSLELTTPDANRVSEKQRDIPVNSTDPAFKKTLAESAREILSGPIHEAWKATGILGKNTLLLIEDLNPSTSIGPKKGKTFREAWETQAVPSVHEKIDQLFSTNLKDDFDPKKDGVVDQALQNFFLNPITALGGAASTESVVSQGTKIGAPEQVFGNAEKVFANEVPITKGAAAMASRQAMAAEKVVAFENVNNFAKVGNFKYTETVSNHLNDVVKRGPYAGELSRPYMKSSQVIDEIRTAGKPIPDPGGIPGALRWDVPGTFRGTEGTWELVLHPESGIIYHFNFK